MALYIRIVRWLMQQGGGAPLLMCDDVMFHTPYAAFVHLAPTIDYYMRPPSRAREMGKQTMTPRQMGRYRDL